MGKHSAPGGGCKSIAIAMLVGVLAAIGVAFYVVASGFTINA